MRYLKKKLCTNGLNLLLIFPRDLVYRKKVIEDPIHHYRLANPTDGTQHAFRLSESKEQDCENQCTTGEP